MPDYFPPSREAQLVTFSNNFSAKITASPAAYGLTTLQSTNYGSVQTNFIAAYNAANDPATRGPLAIATKNARKKALIAITRELAGIVQSLRSVTNEQRMELGLPIRDESRTPVPPPTASPDIDIVSMNGHTLRIRLHNSGSAGRARPAGTTGASVFSAVGPTPPSDIAAWKFEQSTTRTTIDVEFAADLAPGTKVWVTAFWCNARLQSGPACTPIGTLIQYGGLSVAA